MGLGRCKWLPIPVLPYPLIPKLEALDSAQKRIDIARLRWYEGDYCTKLASPTWMILPASHLDCM